MKERIYNLLGKGRKKAIKRSDLVGMSGCSDRAVRNYIEELQLEGYPIINMQNGEGYYIAEKYKELLDYTTQEFKRAEAIITKNEKMLEGWKND